MIKNLLLIIKKALQRNKRAGDKDAYIMALAEGIVGLLKDNDFIVKANRMVIGCKNGRYEEALEDARPDILKHLKNQGGSMRSLAGRIEGEGGIKVQIAPAPEGLEAKTIPSGVLPTAAWFYLDRVNVTVSSLVLSRNGWRETLTPDERYTVGRSKESRDTTVMKTLPDADTSISRWQAEFFCIKGVWYCKSVSEKCQTYVDGRFAEGDEPIPLKKTKKGGQIKFGTGIPGFILHYSANDTRTDTP